MRSESSFNAKSSQDFAPQGFAASAASNLSSVAINAAQQARNLAHSVSGRITPPNTRSGMAFRKRTITIVKMKSLPIQTI
jgi:hypothetical protein